MEITVLVHPNSKHPRVEKDLFKGIHVYVKEPPKEGMANMATLRMLAEYFNIPKSNVFLKRGMKSKKKVFLVSNV